MVSSQQQQQTARRGVLGWLFNSGPIDARALTLVRMKLKIISRDTLAMESADVTMNIVTMGDTEAKSRRTKALPILELTALF
jgi:hypothetical protein